MALWRTRTREPRLLVSHSPDGTLSHAGYRAGRLLGLRSAALCRQWPLPVGEDPGPGCVSDGELGTGVGPQPTSKFHVFSSRPGHTLPLSHPYSPHPYSYSPHLRVTLAPLQLLSSPGCTMSCRDFDFGPFVKGCRHDFDFTLLFQHTVLSLAPSLIFLVTALVRILQLSRKPALPQKRKLLHLKLVRTSYT